MDYVKQPCPYDSAYQRVKGSVSNELWIGRDITAEVPYKGDRSKKAYDHHQAVAF
jgi:hypothetical protein